MIELNFELLTFEPVAHSVNFSMTTRKTLALNPEAATAEAPALKKKGRGWEISDKRLDALHEQAREMRRHSSDAHKALAISLEGLP